MILITGGAGYIGSHCALYLLEKGYKVVVFDNFSTGNNFAIKVLSQYKNFSFVKGDLLNFKDLKNLFKKYNIDFCIHFAACSNIFESVKNPQKYYANNVYGTLNLLSVMKEYNVLKIIFSSSASVYGNCKNIPIKEECDINPINAYGKTKAIIESILDNYDKTNGIKSIRLRYFNVIGADKKSRLGEVHNPESHLVPNIIKSILKDEKMDIYGDDYNTKDGTCVRDYVNIEDLVDAHILALKYLQKENITNTFNIGTKRGYSIKEIINCCEKVTGKKVLYSVKQKRKGDPAILISDNKKAEKILGWKPKKDLEYSIKTVFEWEKRKNKKISKEL